jgi:hypothetical protein
VLFAILFIQLNDNFEIVIPIRKLDEKFSESKSITLKIKYPKKSYLKKTDSFRLEIIDTSTEYKASSINEIERSSNQFNENYFINFESRLELPGITINPSGVVSQNFVKNKNLYYEWDLYPFNQGVFHGTLWLYVNLIPENPADPPIHEILLAKPIQIEVISIFGLSAIWIKILGIVFLLVSFLLRFRILSSKKKNELDRNVEQKISL